MVRVAVYFWNFFKELHGVVSSILLLFLFVAFMSEKLSDFSPIVKIVLILLPFLAGLFLISIIRTKFIAWRNLIETKEVEKEISKIEEDTNLKNFYSSLPSDRTLNHWRKVADLRAVAWSSDAVLNGFSLLIVFTESRTEIDPLISYDSKWKGEELTINFKKKALKERYSKRLFSNTSRKLGKPFFKILSWRKAIKKVLDRVSSGKKEYIEIVIHSHQGNMTIYVIYILGEISHHLNYSFDGKILIDTLSKTEVKVK